MCFSWNLQTDDEEGFAKLNQLIQVVLCAEKVVKQFKVRRIDKKDSSIPQVMEALAHFDKYLVKRNIFVK